MASSTEDLDLAAEVEYLRARVTELEDQLLATEKWGNETVAAAQESLYWLERWHVDLNSVMRRRGADQLRRGARGIRSVYRAGVRAKRRLLAA
jgi:hypothetical protein